MWSACGGALRTCGVGGRARGLFLGQRALAQSYLPVMFQSPCPHLETVGWEKLTLRPAAGGTGGAAGSTVDGPLLAQLLPSSFSERVCRGSRLSYAVVVQSHCRRAHAIR